MDLKRFATLAAAHGGVVARWPAGAQEAAFALMAADPAATEDVLAEALALDEALDALRPPAAPFELRSRILAEAPQPKPELPSLRRWLVGAGVGAGLAIASVAGIAAGMALTRAVTPETHADAVAGFYDDEDAWTLGEGDSRS